MRSSITYAVAAFLSVSSAAKADGIGGGSFVPVEDGFRHECIDVSTKYVSMQVITLQAKRTNSWWKSSKSLGGKFDVTLTNADGKPFVFPRGTTLSAKNITGDVALLPVKFSLMSRYDLAPQQKPFVSVGLGFYVVNLENKSGVIQGIQSFIDFSKTLPLPPNPYIQGLQFFGDFANKVMDENIQTQEEKDPVALFSYDLAQNADDVKNCPSVALRSGINAVLFELNGKVSDGVIPINDVNSYCYWYEAGRLTFRAKSADGSCAKIGPSKPILNPAVAFVVESWSKNPSATTPGAVVSAPATAAANPVADHPVSLDDAKLALGKHNQIFQVDRTEPLNVLTYTNMFDKKGFDVSAVAEALKTMKNPNDPARVVEAETARHLRLCSIAEIPLDQCN